MDFYCGYSHYRSTRDWTILSVWRKGCASVNRQVILGFGVGIRIRALLSRSVMGNTRLYAFAGGFDDHVFLINRIPLILGGKQWPRYSLTPSDLGKQDYPIQSQGNGDCVNPSSEGSSPSISVVFTSPQTSMTYLLASAYADPHHLVLGVRSAFQKVHVSKVLTHLGMDPRLKFLPKPSFQSRYL